MAADTDAVVDPDEVAPISPWPVMLGGLGALTLASVLFFVAPDSGLLLGLRIVLLIVGLLASGAAVALRPLPSVVFLGAFGALMAAAGGQRWDSFQLACKVMAAIGVMASCILLLPSFGRRLAVSGLIVLHFGGILCAVGSVPPPNNQPNWIVIQLWTRFYRPYLQFFYLNNAYHFYSPEPGPASLLWFRVEFADGTSVRTKVIERDLYTTRLQYQRRLSLTEHTNQLQPPPAIETPMMRKIYADRVQRGHIDGIPLHPFIPMSLQFREPVPMAKLLLSSYARYVARTTVHPTDPSQAVVGVKIYRVVHQILTAPEMAQNISPLDPVTHHVFYQGEFDPDGTLKPSCFKAEWRETPESVGYEPIYQDPYLYWLIPIVRGVPEAPDDPNAPMGFRAMMPDAPDLRGRRWVDLPVKNFVKIHAGDKDDGGDVW
jgi:hypothetical protein